MARSKSELYDIGKDSPYKVTGSVPMSGLVDNVDNLNGGLEQIDGEGTQSGSHPAKTQSKVMRYI